MGKIEVDSSKFYEELPIGVMRVHPDPEATILMANPAAAQMFGYASVEELLEVPGGELVEDPSVRAALIEELAARGGVLGREVRLKRKDGSPVWVSVRAKAVHSKRGEIQYIEAVAIDITRQKQVEEWLRNSEAQFRAIFASTVEGILVYDKDYNYLYANQAAIDHAGVTRDRVVGKNIRDAVGHMPDFMELWKSRIDRVFATGEPMHVEDRSVIGERIVWSESTVSPIQDNSGETFAVGIVYRDVSDRKLAEQALRESEEKYRALVERMNDVPYTTNAEGIATYIGPQIARYGLRPEEVTSRRFLEFLVPEDRERVARDFQETMSTGREFPTEFRIANKEGQVYWLEDHGKVQRDATGRIVGMTGVLRDISDRKRAEDALRESEEKYRRLFTTVSDPIMIFDAETRRFIDVNESALRLYGYPREEFLELRHTDLTAEPEASEASIRETLAGKRESVPLRYHRNKDGTVFPVEISTGAFVLDGRDVLCGVVRDITESKRAEEALRAAHRRLVNAREEERKRLARDLHDAFGQTLIALSFELANIRKEHASTLDQPTAEALAALSSRCGEMIQDVRRMSYGLYPAALEQFGVAAAIRQLTSICKLAKVEATVRCSKAAEDARFPSDVEIGLFRVAQEAMNNALRHAHCERIEVKLSCSKGRLVLRILDDGVGFDPKDAVGKGFGLTSMNERARAVNGNLHIASRPGRTSVELRVPIPGP